jgi:hypothetical protein
MSSLSVKQSLERLFNHISIYRKNGGKITIYTTLAVGKLELLVLDQMSSLMVQRSLEILFIPSYRHLTQKQR